MIAQNFPGLRTARGSSTILGALSRLLGAQRTLRTSSLGIADDDDDESEQGWSADPASWYDKVEGPQEAGLDLLKGGEFGQVGLTTASSKTRAMSLQRMLMQRQMNMRPMDREELARVCSLASYYRFATRR